ncbi:MAG: hypothetical protein ACLFQX_03705 [Candidatus Kapaibacterium sp.]
MRRSLNTLAIIAIILAIGIAFNQYSEADSSPKIESNLENYAKRYGARFYKSLFSLPETRPYSIIQFDETSQMYDNQWIPPEQLVGALDEFELEELISRNAELIGDKSEAEQIAILRKINSWCLCEMQMDYINDWLGFPESELLQIAQNNPKTRFLFTKFHQQGGFNIKHMSDEQMNEAYYDVINTLAGLDFPVQMHFWANIYGQLEVVAASN